MKNPLLYRSAWPESSREASERFLMETLGRTQSERRRRLALAGGFRLLPMMRARAEPIFVTGAHRGDGKRFIVRADEMLTAFVELQRTIHEFAVSLIS